MIKRLRTKFVIINMTIVTVMLVVISFLILFFMGIGMETQIRQQMQELAETSLRPEIPGNIPGDWRQEGRYSGMVIHVDPQGDLWVDSNGLLEETDEEAVKAYTRQVLAREESYGMLEGENLRFQRRKQPFGETVVLMDVSGEMETLRNLLKTCLLISGISFCMFLGISFVLAKWAVAPVEKAWKQQRQFVADASHELKTPLTVIMTNAELLQSPESSEEDRSQFAGSILTMSRQMRGLVESLLDLARVDNGTTKMVFSRLDFSDLATNCLLPFEPVYFEKGLQLESTIDDGLQVKGSMAHLRQVVEILLDNGAKYSDPGGTVVVTAKRQGNSCLLSVASPGEPISREDLKNIFKRFYRIDKARAMNRSYGLGLAIAESIIHEHGGKIWAESHGGINTFFVQLTAL